VLQVLAHYLHERLLFPVRVLEFGVGAGTHAVAAGGQTGAFCVFGEFGEGLYLSGVLVPEVVDGLGRGVEVGELVEEGVEDAVFGDGEAVDESGRRVGTTGELSGSGKILYWFSEFPRRVGTI